ncbi:VIT domain-containing protein [Persicirhabdus sediminis]|uniref:VIT domain-containing protein n=1 Tax=Persicirhabdus sediminis TaxID=454144 RepID=A0A8J7MED7_9BACT|nr:VIT domain-containing protein [Persicirhabdus sediminis]MBK1790294.1 hypothetical protein [Persicirhabdus sediminis]
MRRLGFILQLLMLVSAVAAPQMWVKDGTGRVPLRIESLDYQVQVVDSMAETTIEVVFANDTSSMQEGEFVMPLPAGATISSYALDVNGEMRDGVVVEKERARHAYETIKAQMVDPGLVEREANNVYRTRVFPIPANGLKRMRIGYVERLPQEDGKFIYQQAIGQPGKLGKFSFILRGIGLDESCIKADKLEFVAELDYLKATQENFQPAGLVKCEIGLGELPRITKQSGNRTFSSIMFRVPEDLLPVARPKPKQVTLLWDVSESMLAYKKEKVVELIYQYLAEVDAESVQLVTLRNELEVVGKFVLKGNGLAQLKKHVDEIYYDGMVDWSLVGYGSKEWQAIKSSGVVLCITDGNSLKASEVSYKLHQRAAWFYLDLAGRVETFDDSAASDQAGYEVVDLSEGEQSDHLAALTMAPYKLTKIKDDDRNIYNGYKPVVAGEVVDMLVPGSRNGSYSAVFENAHAGAKTLQLGDNVKHVSSLASHLIEKIWAQEKLAQLEKEGNAEQIIRHSKKHGLVSDYTSMIVLEKLSDYVRFEIPPPDRQMHLKWRQQMRAKEERDPFSVMPDSHLRDWWAARQAWYQSSYPSIESSLLPTYAQLDYWLKAQDEVFQPDELDVSVRADFVTLRDDGKKLIEASADVRSLQDFDKWKAKRASWLERWLASENWPVQREKNQVLAVSVRGRVLSPDVYRSEDDASLKQFLIKAGGTYNPSDLERVAVYRNGRGSLYNLFSKEYVDEPMKPGDMVVLVGEDPYGDGWDCFCAGGSDPSSKPAVSKNSMRLNMQQAQRMNPVGGGESLGGAKHEQSAKVNVLAGEPLDQAWMESFAQDLKSTKDAAASYHKLKAGRIRHEAFYMRAAKLLADAGHEDLARQVASNLLERGRYEPSGYLAYAYVLVQIDQLDEAVRVLDLAKRVYPKVDRLSFAMAVVKQAMQRIEPAKLNSQLKEVISDQWLNRAMRGQALMMALHGGDIAFPERYKTVYKNEELDVRVVLLHSDMRSPISVTIKDAPEAVELGLKSGDREWTSDHGTRLTRFTGGVELAQKRMLPGLLEIQIGSSSAQMIFVRVYRNWGRENETSSYLVVTHDGGKDGVNLTPIVHQFTE